MHNHLYIIEFFYPDNKNINGFTGFQCGFITYDHKNNLENLTSKNPKRHDFPDSFFFTPEHIEVKKNQLIAYDGPPVDLENYFKHKFPESTKKIKLQSRETKSSYLNKIAQIKKHLQRGDIYELNFCHEFYVEDILVNPYRLYKKLKEKSPVPFACFVKHNEEYLMCASPERFLKKTGNKLIAQPMKGTIRRSLDPVEDEALKKQLKNDPKERSENIMIVDLVRNDLSKIAQRNSVKVEELCGVYSFPKVHQMISTISCQLKEKVSFWDIIKATFPMGSMTGAPKISAMKLIDTYEATRRGIYSGSVGYILPNGDFDFNVVIRSMVYNAKKRYLSFMVGGAITINSDPEKEYEETLLKAKAIFEVLNETAVRK